MCSICAPSCRPTWSPMPPTGGMACHRQCRCILSCSSSGAPQGGTSLGNMVVRSVTLQSPHSPETAWQHTKLQLQGRARIVTRPQRCMLSLPRGDASDYRLIPEGQCPALIRGASSFAVRGAMGQGLCEAFGMAEGHARAQAGTPSTKLPEHCVVSTCCLLVETTCVIQFLLSMRGPCETQAQPCSTST